MTKSFLFVLLSLFVFLSWQPPGSLADGAPSKIVMLASSGEQETLAPYVASVRLYLKDLPVILETRWIGGPPDARQAGELARTEQACLVFWASEAVTSVSFFYPALGDGQEARRSLDTSPGEEGSIEAFALVVHAAVSAVLENTGAPEEPPGEHAPGAEAKASPTAEARDTVPVDDPAFATLPAPGVFQDQPSPREEKEAAEGDVKTGDTPGAKAPAPDDAKAEEEGQKAAASADGPHEDALSTTKPPGGETSPNSAVAHEWLALDLGYRLTVFGSDHPAVHSIDLAVKLRLTKMFGLILGYGFTFTTQIDDEISFNIKRYPVLLGGRLWWRWKRIEMGALLGIAITYVNPGNLEVPSAYDAAQVKGHAEIALAALAKSRLNIWKRLWLYAALGAEVPVRLKHYGYVDENGVTQQMAQSWPARPVVALGLSLVLF